MEDMTSLLRDMLGVFILKSMIWLVLSPLAIAWIVIKKMPRSKWHENGKSINSDDNNAETIPATGAKLAPFDCGKAFAVPPIRLDDKLS